MPNILNEFVYYIKILIKLMNDKKDGLKYKWNEISCDLNANMKNVRSEKEIVIKGNDIVRMGFKK